MTLGLRPGQTIVVCVLDGISQIKGMLAAVGIGIHIEHRRESPALGRQEETVVAQMIIGVADEIRKDHAAPEFLEIGLRCNAVLRQPLRDFEITMIPFAIGRAKHRHRRCIMNAPRSLTVKTFREECRAGLGQLLALGFRNIQPQLARNDARLVLQSADVARADESICVPIDQARHRTKNRIPC